MAQDQLWMQTGSWKDPVSSCSCDPRAPGGPSEQRWWSYLCSLVCLKSCETSSSLAVFGYGELWHRLLCIFIGLIIIKCGYLSSWKMCQSVKYLFMLPTFSSFSFCLQGPYCLLIVLWIVFLYSRSIFMLYDIYVCGYLFHFQYLFCVGSYACRGNRVTCAGWGLEVGGWFSSTR